MSPRRKNRRVIYTFKVALADDRRIWRRIAIAATATLGRLHTIIFEAFDREGEHLWSFYVAPPGTKGGLARRRAAAYTYFHPDMLGAGLFAADEVNIEDATHATIGGLSLVEGQIIDYLFNFDNARWHEITLESIEKDQTSQRYPKILQEHGKSPNPCLRR